MKPSADDLRTLIASICRVPAETITDETRFVQDLAMDSIASLDLLTELEETHGIVITQEQARHVQTFGKLMAYIDAMEI
jgi:acyl carrier protein